MMAATPGFADYTLRSPTIADYLEERCIFSCCLSEPVGSGQREDGQRANEIRGQRNQVGLCTL